MQMESNNEQLEKQRLKQKFNHRGFKSRMTFLLNNPAGRSEWNTEMDKEERGKWEEKVHKKATVVRSNGEASWFLTWAAMLPTYGKSSDETHRPRF